MQQLIYQHVPIAPLVQIIDSYTMPTDGELIEAFAKGLFVHAELRALKSFGPLDGFPFTPSFIKSRFGRLGRAKLQGIEFVGPFIQFRRSRFPVEYTYSLYDERRQHLFELEREK